MEWDNLAVIPVSTYRRLVDQTDWLQGTEQSQAGGEKGVELREVPFNDTLVTGVWEIYNECPIRQGRRFSHYGQDLESVDEETSTFLDSSFFIGAYLSDELIGFAKLTYDETQSQAGLMHIVSKIAHRDKAPTNALIASAVRSCAERQIRYLVYSNFAYGKKEHDSLSDFKERCGFQRMEVPRYYVPLTPLGRMAFSLGLHHRLLTACRGGCRPRLREYRNAWYNRKMSEAVR